MDELSPKIRNHLPKSLPLTSTTTATTYSFKEPDHYGHWAIATVNDRTGELQITSDWGNWAFRWSADPTHLGMPTLTHFIGYRGDAHYLANKLTTRESRENFDPHATVIALKKRLIAARMEQCRYWIRYYEGDYPEEPGTSVIDEMPRHAERRGPERWGCKDEVPLDRGAARALYDAIDDLRGCQRVEEFQTQLAEIRYIEWVVEDIYYCDYLVFEPDQAYMVLLHSILPALIKACGERPHVKMYSERAPCSFVGPPQPYVYNGQTENKHADFRGTHLGHGCPYDLKMTATEIAAMGTR